ncbi:hypothetical protein MCHI_001540 [Candidatus Magnetoovum chiemensis]|nr:hypothetical protein MCHI_001540 [Candidatus Magnetoovum chiemensis]
MGENVEDKEDCYSLPIRFEKGRKSVFVDWHIVEAGYGMPFWKSYQDKHGTHPWFSPSGVKLTVMQPEIDEEPFIEKDPTGNLRAYSTLIYDEGVYRFWYETDGFQGKGDAGAVLCLMESGDCVCWTSRRVGLIEFNASLDNNLVYGYGAEEKGGIIAAHGASVFIDPSDDETRRYKLLNIGPAPKGQFPYSWLYGAYSKDGVNWTKYAEPIAKHSSDTQSVGLFDKTLGKYVIYVRGWSPQSKTGAGGRRVIKRGESSDFSLFKDLETVLSPLPSWGPWADIYTNAYHKWPGADRAHLMLPALYYRNSDMLDVHLALSRDGKRWHFPTDAPIISNGQRAESVAIYAGKGMVPYGKGLWAFPVYVSRKGHNQYSHSKPGIHLAAIREDGFICIEAELIGEFYTYPCVFTGKTMVINSFSYPGGEIKIEFLRPKNNLEYAPIENFSLQDCQPITGDSMWKTVKWKSEDYLSELAGEVIRIRFYMVRSRIFAFKFI